MFGSLGLPELLVILAIVLLLFGVGKLPKLGEGLGTAIRNFREGITSGDRSGGDVGGAGRDGDR